MSTKRTNPDFLNGVPELVILKLLAERPMHGYDVVLAIREATRETLNFGEGCVYPVLHKLEHQGLLASRRERVGGRNRVVYRVTAAGRRRLADSSDSWRRIASAVSHILRGDEHGSPRLAGILGS